MLDQDRALSAGLVCDVDSPTTGAFGARKEDRVMLGVDRLTRHEIVVYTSRSIIVRKKPTRTPTFIAVYFA